MNIKLFSTTSTFLSLLLALFLLQPVTHAKNSKSMITIAYGLENYNFAPLFKQFTLETGIVIQIAAFKNNDLKAELLQRSNINQLPDAVIVPSDFLGLSEINYSPIPASLFSAELSTDAKESTKLGKQYLGIPIISGNHLVLYYNKKIIQEPATTWRILEQQAQSLGKPIIGWSYHEMYWFMAFVGSFDAYPLQQGKINFQTTGLMDAMVWYKSLADKKLVNTKCNYTCAVDSFIKGSLAYTINGAWAFQQFTEQLGDDLGVTLLPNFQGRKMAPYFSSHVIAFPNNSLTNSKSIELTALAQFFQRPTIQQQMWQEMKVLPSNSLIKKQIMLSDNHNVQQLLLQLDNAKPMPTEHSMAVVWEALLKGMNRYLAGVFDAKKATEYMQYITEKSLNDEQ